MTGYTFYGESPKCDFKVGDWLSLSNVGNIDAPRVFKTHKIDYKNGDVYFLGKKKIEGYINFIFLKPATTLEKLYGRLFYPNPDYRDWDIIADIELHPRTLNDFYQYLKHPNSRRSGIDGSQHIHSSYNIEGRIRKQTNKGKIALCRFFSYKSDLVFCAEPIKPKATLLMDDFIFGLDPKYGINFD